MTIFAQGTDYTVQAEQVGTIGSGTLTYTYTLTNENGDRLTNENDDVLVADVIETTYGEIIYARETSYTVEA